MKSSTSRPSLIHLLTILLLCCLTASLNAESEREKNLNVLIVVDGMRPDYITPDRMPHLYALGERGVFGETHSAAYPSVTRVNSASISTGSYPRTHGLMHNTMWVPEMSEEAFGTGTARNLRRLDEFTGGKLLTAPSMGEILAEHGLRLFVTGSGGSGNALLQNPRGKGMGIWTARGFFVPDDAEEKAVKALGEPPRANPERTVWALDAYLHKLLSDDRPDAIIIWINEPDSAGHSHGVGSPEALEAIANVDAMIGRMVAAHEEHNLSHRVNIFVTTDHGFTTNTGRFSLTRTLRQNGLEDDVTVVSNMIFLQKEDPALLTRVVEALQRDDQVGAIYTRPLHPGSHKGAVPGTLSFSLIQWDHERSADIIVSPAWTDEVNEFGFAGATTRSGVATHGSDSPYDLRIRLVAAGPDLKRGVRSTAPTGNVDLAPTILHLFGIEPPSSMDGRVLHELLKDGPAFEEVNVQNTTHRAATTLDDGFRYKTEHQTLQVGSTVYLRGGQTFRE